MSITLSELSYAQLALYCLFFFLMLIGASIFLILYMLFSNFLENFVIKVVELKYFKNFPDNMNDYILLKLIRKASKTKRIIKMIFNWLEKIIGISVILLIFLLLIKFLIKNETFAYTIVTLLIFVLSSQIASYIKSTWNTDKYIFSPIVDIGELIEINEKRGFVVDIGKDYFWIKIEEGGVTKLMRISIRDLNSLRLSKITSRNTKSDKLKMFKVKKKINKNK